jgi:hypothetical protein
VVDKTETTILLDVYERLGAIETTLKNLNESHKSMDTDVEDLKQFKGRVAAYIWLGGSVASGVLFFLWEGLKYGVDHWLKR